MKASNLTSPNSIFYFLPLQPQKTIIITIISLLFFSSLSSFIDHVFLRQRNSTEHPHRRDISAGLVTVNRSQFNQDWVGWAPCDLHRRKTVGDIFVSNEASLEMFPAAMEQCKSSTGTRYDNVRLVEMESERDDRKKGGAVDHVLLFSLPWLSLLSQTERKYLNLFWARNCVCCSPVVSLPCYSDWRVSTHGISLTERHLLQACTRTFAHTNCKPSKQMHKHCSCTFPGIPLKYVDRHAFMSLNTVWDKEICHFSVKGVHLPYL